MQQLPRVRRRHVIIHLIVDRARGLLHLRFRPRRRDRAEVDVRLGLLALCGDRRGHEDLRHRDDARRADVVREIHRGADGEVVRGAHAEVHAAAAHQLRVPRDRLVRLHGALVLRGRYVVRGEERHRAAVGRVKSVLHVSRAGQPVLLDGKGGDLQHEVVFLPVPSLELGRGNPLPLQARGVGIGCGQPDDWQLLPEAREPVRPVEARFGPRLLARPVKLSPPHAVDLKHHRVAPHMLPRYRGGDEVPAPIVVHLHRRGAQILCKSQRDRQHQHR
mmetsp:Transcript_10215/g.24965  ORF Transcript_10215/g.24965 Transcript_10215/m.24965 type:complete len:275 (-) Transcript_10215:83-907(-)